GQRAEAVGQIRVSGRQRGAPDAQGLLEQRRRHVGIARGEPWVAEISHRRRHLGVVVAERGSPDLERLAYQCLGAGAVAEAPEPQRRAPEEVSEPHVIRAPARALLLQHVQVEATRLVELPEARERVRQISYRSQTVGVGWLD